MFTLNATMAIGGTVSKVEYKGTGAGIAFEILSDLVDAEEITVSRKDLPNDPSFGLALRHKLARQPNFKVVD